MDDLERREQKDHAEKLRQERFLAQTLGTTRSKARQILKQAIIDRQFAADRAKNAAALVRPPAPQIIIRETRVEVIRTVFPEETKRQNLPLPLDPKPFAIPYPTDEGYYVLHVDSMGVPEWILTESSEVTLCSEGSTTTRLALTVPS